MKSIRIKEEKLDYIIPGSATGVVVQDGDCNKAIRRFKKNVKNSEKIKEVYNRKYHRTKGQKRKKVIESAKHFQQIRSKKESLK